MDGYQHGVDIKKLQPKVKKGVWEVMLTDPQLNKFTFGPSLIGQYIMTDIVSPYGQKSVLYNTVSTSDKPYIKIDLNFESIDDCNITAIRLVSTKLFFKKWKVSLVDNRKNEKYILSNSELFEDEPKIVLNKLFGLGFMPKNDTQKKNFFELHLEKI